MEENREDDFTGCVDGNEVDLDGELNGDIKEEICGADKAEKDT